MASAALKRFVHEKIFLGMSLREYVRSNLTIANGIAAASEYDRNGRGCIFCRVCRAAGCCDHVDLTADEIGGQCRQSVVAAFCPAVFDSHVFSLSVADFSRSLTESN